MVFTPLYYVLGFCGSVHQKVKHVCCQCWGAKDSDFFQSIGYYLLLKCLPSPALLWMAFLYVCRFVI